MWPKSVGTWQLFEKWAPANMEESYILVDCGVPTPTDYLAVAGHNFGRVSASMIYEGCDTVDGDWVTLVDFSGAIPPLYDGTYSYDGEITYNSQYTSAAVSNKVLGWKYDQVTYRYYRMRVWASAGVPTIGLICSGLKMTFEVGFYGGFTPADWNDEAEVSNSRSDKGLFLGRSIARFGLRDFAINLSPVTHAWVDNVWMPFKTHAQRYPFIFAWGDDPDNNRAYAWAKSWAPSKVKNIKHAEVGVNCEGTAE